MQNEYVYPTIYTCYWSANFCQPSGHVTNVVPNPFERGLGQNDSFTDSLLSKITIEARQPRKRLCSSLNQLRQRPKVD